MKVWVGVLTLFLVVPVATAGFFSQDEKEPASSSAPVPQGPSLEQRVQLLERRINTLSNIVLRLDSLQREMQQLRGDVEVQNHAMETMKKRQRDLYMDIDQRISKLASRKPNQRSATTMRPTTGQHWQSQPSRATPTVGQSVPSQPTVPVSNTGGSSISGMPPVTGVDAQQQSAIQTGSVRGSLPPVVSSSRVTAQPQVARITTPRRPVFSTPGRPSVTTPVTTPRQPIRQDANPQFEKADYQQAFNTLMDRRYDEAQQAFRLFLNSYPRSTLADNAQYWLAEANYVTRDFDGALTEFGKVIQDYPSSPKVSDAMLKIGYIQYEKKEWGAARGTLENLTRRYPSSTASQLAKKRLDKLQREGH